MRIVIIIARAFIAAVLIGIALIWIARADEMEDLIKRHYFQAVKSATLRNGEIQNCCGEGDAVKVEVVGQAPGGIIVARIIDTMKSANGKVGDMIEVPPEKITVRLYSPFAEPIAFIDGLNRPYCLSFPSGG